MTVSSTVIVVALELLQELPIYRRARPAKSRLGRFGKEPRPEPRAETAENQFFGPSRNGPAGESSTRPERFFSVVFVVQSWRRLFWIDRIRDSKKRLTKPW
jgi:hypothetical protein